MTWRRVDPYFARRVQLSSFLVGMLFGLDYLLTPPNSASALTWVERSFVPLWLWGAAIIVASLVGFITEKFVLADDHPILDTPARRRWGWVTTGAHVMLFAAFVVLAMSVSIEIVTRADDLTPAGHPVGFYGIRTPVFWAGYAWLNWQFIPRGVRV